MTIERIYYQKNLEIDRDYEGRERGRNEVLTRVPAEQANLISSQTTAGYHAPVLDFDFPCRLVPSSTPDHYHLYIDKEIHWDAYEKLLFALFDAGLIEAGWYRTARREGATFVRKPDVLKEDSPFAILRKEKEELEEQVAQLRRELQEAELRLEEADSGISMSWS